MSEPSNKALKLTKHRTGKTDAALRSLAPVLSGRSWYRRSFERPSQSARTRGET